MRQVLALVAEGPILPVELADRFELPLREIRWILLGLQRRRLATCPPSGRRSRVTSHGRRYLESTAQEVTPGPRGGRTPARAHRLTTAWNHLPKTLGTKCGSTDTQ